VTEARVDQGGLYALGSTVPGTRVDQAGLYALADAGVEVRIDQAGLYALVAITAEVPVAQAGLYALASGSPCGTKWCQIWTIERTDGEIFRFTSKDTDFEWGGESYGACDSLVPSASENVSEVDAAGSMDLSGALGEITEEALYSGLFDGAEVSAWLVPWAGEGMPKRLLKGTFGSVEQSPNGFKVELIGDGAKLMQTPLVRRLQPGCWKTFGDRFCQKDLGPLTVTGTVDSGTGQRSFVDAARGETAGYFSRGRVTFTSGLNDGISAEIKEHTAGGNFELWPRLPFPIIAGVTYSMTPGCTLLRESSGGTNGCTAWANEPNFGGAENVPGRDATANPPITEADD
jgi:uncharacterized phage protein (TIGR02218 family)